jgi:Cys-tRNA(Pro)/Cys-tRNA(Cys) deacylase
MTDSSSRVTAAADALGLDYVVTRLGPVRSLEEAADALGILPRQIAKTLVIRVAEGSYVLVLVPGDRQIAWPRLRALLGVNRAHLPSPDEAKEATGFERGTIGPLGTSRSWPVVLDATLTGPIHIGAGAHGVGLAVDATALAAAVGATVADISDQPALPKTVG